MYVWACLFGLFGLLGSYEERTNRPNRHAQYISSWATQFLITLCTQFRPKLMTFFKNSPLVENLTVQNIWNLKVQTIIDMLDLNLKMLKSQGKGPTIIDLNTNKCARSSLVEAGERQKSKQMLKKEFTEQNTYSLIQLGQKIEDTLHWIESVTPLLLKSMTFTAKKTNKSYNLRV